MSNEYTPERYMPGVLAAQKATKGKPKSEEWKAKARASWTPERRAALSARMKGNKHSRGRAAGFKLTEETREKISQSRNGKTFRKDGRSHLDPTVQREKKLKYRYHVELEWYERKLSEQGGHCALCPATHGWNGRLLGVDHDHKCCPALRSRGKKDKICGKCRRGLLCDQCNNLIGMLERTDSGWVQRALSYLAHYSMRPRR